MTRAVFLTMGVFAAAAAAMTAAESPRALGQAAPGLWEIAGIPGAQAPVRECVGDVALLAQYEHRRQRCGRQLISTGGSSAVYEYRCTGEGFGRSKVTVITPRSLRIETQGISGGMPFNYVLQARRVSDCKS
jgi:hypothetical protein